jgi:hypothetical protein
MPPPPDVNWLTSNVVDSISEVSQNPSGELSSRMKNPTLKVPARFGKDSVEKSSEVE